MCRMMRDEDLRWTKSNWHERISMWMYLILREESVFSSIVDIMNAYDKTTVWVRLWEDMH